MYSQIELMHCLMCKLSQLKLKYKGDHTSRLNLSFFKVSFHIKVPIEDHDLDVLLAINIRLGQGGNQDHLENILSP